MKATAHTILSATTGIGLTAFTIFSAFTANASTAVTATAFGLLALYGMVEMAILSYTPRRSASRSTTLRVIAPPAATAPMPTVVRFPARPTRARAA